jgi:hypothetical protein
LQLLFEVQAPQTPLLQACVLPHSLFEEQAEQRPLEEQILPPEQSALF